MVKCPGPIYSTVIREIQGNHRLLYLMKNQPSDLYVFITKTKHFPMIHILIIGLLQSFFFFFCVCVCALRRRQKTHSIYP